MILVLECAQFVRGTTFNNEEQAKKTSPHLTFLCAELWVLLSLSVKLSDNDEAVVVLDRPPILSLLFLRMSESLWVTVGCLAA